MLFIASKFINNLYMLI